MEIKLTHDMDLVSSIMKEPEIWDAISGQYGDIIEEFQPRPDWAYLVGYVKLQPIGLFIVHQTSFGLWQCHVQVLPEHRTMHAVEFGEKVVKWVWDNTEINKLIALIPEIYPNVKKFSELQGFREEGYITKSYSKNGKYHDCWLVAINRGE